VSPEYAPLNPSLKVYFEIGNELWNQAGVFNNDYSNIDLQVKDDVIAQNSNYDAFNYDGLSTAVDAGGVYVSMLFWRYRWIILRTIQISNIFRTIFGDSAMPFTSADPQVRPLYEWQYGNLNSTASRALTWADSYFNKTDPASTYSGDAKPIKYFIAGGGGAAYYGAVNGNGLTNLISDPSFETPLVPSGYNLAPVGASWIFTGMAGIARYSNGSDGVPTPYEGQQVGYLTGVSTMTTSFTVPASHVSDRYAAVFKAHNYKLGSAAAHKQNLRVYLDYGTVNQIDITAKTFNQTNGYTPPAISQITPWKARNVFWVDSTYYYTKDVSLAPGSVHTLTICGMGDITASALPNQIAFIEDVRITSVDAIFNGGIPGGGDAGVICSVEVSVLGCHVE
jgi:hypothetical protein